MARMMEHMTRMMDPATATLIDSDVNELMLAAKKLIGDATQLGGLHFGSFFLRWLASFAAMYIYISFISIYDNKYECPFNFFLHLCLRIII